FRGVAGCGSGIAFTETRLKTCLASFFAIANGSLPRRGGSGKATLWSEGETFPFIKIKIGDVDKKQPEISSVFYPDKFPLETCSINGRSSFHYGAA
ncbi:MAG: hypothetical protein IJJ71_06430, partial [Treponema sp.]|uniref:hypothetical protein n=1 Tax=Treponema sp. TaxID=166 RepID=UPI0025E2C3D8